MFLKKKSTIKAYLHKVKVFVFFSFIINCCCLSGFSQFSLSFPTNRVVFQRNNENIGFVNIIGNYTETIDKIEAKLTPIVVGQGTETDWTPIQGNIKAGYFAGKIQGQGGWYKLEVRAIKNTTVLKTMTVEKVGIGEVFIALGQSNAQGIPNYGAKGATDDRVNTINFQNVDVLDPLPENLNFVHLSDNVNIAPQGDGPWCYGELGDLLAKRLNVPVTFFNAGLLLVSVINWRESAEGLPTFNFVLDVGGQFQLPKGLPYINLRNTLNYYGSLMGVRSLLWLQGETDNLPNRLSSAVYSANLQKLIDISRNDFDEKLTWMVARTSLTYLGPSNPEIVGGQNDVINKADNNVFAGPFTDTLQVPRLDDVHFKNIPGNMGISLLAESWDKFLDDNFFQKSTPILAKPIIEPEISCDSNQQISLKIPAIYKDFVWSNGSKNNQISVDKGQFSVALKDFKGNYLLVPSINTEYIYTKQKPIITSNRNLSFCADDPSYKVELTAFGEEFQSFKWLSGQQTQKINVSQSGEFSVKGINEFGCISAESEKVVVQANPIPFQPKIVVFPANNVCEGQSITLSTDAVNKIIWSNRDTTKSISINNVGHYEFSAKSINEFGCVSPNSSIQQLSINALPNQPSIQQIGIFSLQAVNGSFMTNDEFEWKKDDILFSKTSTPTIKVSQIGTYEVSTLRQYKIANNQLLTCTSKPSEKIVLQTSSNRLTLYPNPTTELIYLETKEIIKNLEVKFYTSAGKQVYKFRLDDTSERRIIDVRILEKGHYIVKIKGVDFEESARLIIE